MTTGPGPLILLVDDFTDAREMYEEYLTFRGFRVVTADSGKEALRVAHLPDRPALILMDLQMAAPDGTTVMKALRKESAFTGVPIVAFTAHALREQREVAISEGFDAVIAKPCLPDHLITLIEPLLISNRSAST